MNRTKPKLGSLISRGGEGSRPRYWGIVRELTKSRDTHSLQVIVMWNKLSGGFVNEIIYVNSIGDTMRVEVE